MSYILYECVLCDFLITMIEENENNRELYS